MTDKLLLVEPNKTLAKLLAKKIKLALNIEIDMAHSLTKAKELLSANNYFLVLLDLILPDAPDGKIVDTALEYKTHIIVLTSKVDDKFRQEIKNKNILDYVNKSSIYDIEYIIHTIQRLQNNKKHTLLVVDDSPTMRKKIKNLLENMFFTVLVASNGIEALEILNKHNISMILTDYNMPKMDGLQLIQKVRENFSKTSLPILTISANEYENISSIFLKNGANDFIKKPFSREEFFCRVHNNIEFLESINTIKEHANKDFLTGLYNRRYFFRNIKKTFTHNSMAIAMIDIDNFKNINDTYGHDIGDKVIIALANILKSFTKPDDIVARFGGEEFCLIINDVDEKIAMKIFERIRKEAEKFSIFIKNHTIKFTVSIGATMINSDFNIEKNIKIADNMLYKAKSKGKNKIYFYKEEALA